MFRNTVPKFYTATPASTPALTTLLGPDQGINAAGVSSVAGWSVNFPSVNSPVALESVPAPIIPSLPASTNPTISQVSPNAYAATLSLGIVQALQLVPSFNDAHGTPVTAVAPNVFGFIYTSRNVKVATVSSTGLVTPVARGEACVLIGSARAANLPFAGASAPAGLIGCETFCELNVQVLD
jgi:hypothetical protein